MKLITKSCLVVATALLVSLSAKPAQAWFQICNRSSEQIQAAFGYLNAADNRDVNYDSDTQSMSEYTGWMATGWYHLSSGQCLSPYPHELWRRNRYYYVYAESSNGKVWGGNISFCVDPVNRFSWNERRDGKCNGVFKKFYGVDIGGGKVQNFTFTFN